MALAAITLAPGVDVEKTATLNSGGWTAANAVRFREGLPEKDGGWQRYINALVVGTARGMEAWADLANNSYLAIGSEQQLQLVAAGSLLNITPIEQTDNLAPAFTTTLGSKTVTIADAGYNPAAGDWMSVLVPVSIGGIVLQGDYLVQTALAPSFTIMAASAATAAAGPGGAVPSYAVTLASSDVVVTLNNHGLAANDTYVNQVATTVHGITFAAFSSFTVLAPVTANTFHITGGVVGTGNGAGSENGGNARLVYYLPSGLASATLAAGYGEGLFGAGLYGVSAQGTTFTALRQWFMDHWGEDLICNFTGGPVIVWIPPVAGKNQAQVIDGTNFPSSIDPPTKVNVSFVSMPQRIAVVLGVDPVGGGNQDPNLIRWSDVNDFTNWLATATNQAGSFRIPSGSMIVGGVQAPLFGMIWTDEDVWLMTYQGFPLVFGFQKIGVGMDLLAGRAAGIYGNSVYWASSNAFWVFDGQTPRILDCPVWDFFWKNLNRTQKDKVFCAVNSYFNEVSWYFPSLSGNGEVDSYIRYNARENVWDYGSRVRTAWIDEGVLGAPMGVDGSNLIQQHEVAYDNDGQPMNEFVKSGFFAIESQTPLGPNAAVSDGTVFSTVKEFVSDFIFLGPTPSVQVTLFFQNRPQDSIVTYGPYTFSPAGPPLVLPKARGRMMAIQIGFSTVGTFWRGGKQRYRGVPSGKR